MAQCYFRAIVEKSIIYYVSITLPPPLLRALTGMIPRHTRVSPTPVTATATPLPIPAPYEIQQELHLVVTAFGGSYLSIQHSSWFPFRVSLAFDSLLVPRSVLTEFRCIKVWWPPPHPECWHLKFTFGQSLAMFPFAKHLLQSPPRCFFLFMIVSADQDCSRLCPYLSIHFVFELALYLTILYGMAT